MTPAGGRASRGLPARQPQGGVLVTADHDFVQMLFASGDAAPSLILVRDVEALNAGELATLLLDALAYGLAEMFPGHRRGPGRVNSHQPLGKRMLPRMLCFDRGRERVTMVVGLCSTSTKPR